MTIKILRITSILEAGADVHVHNINREVNKSNKFQSYMVSPREKNSSEEYKYLVGSNISYINIVFNYMKTKFLGLDSIFSNSWMKFFNSEQ